MMDSDIVVREFELLSHSYVHFGTNAPWEKYEPLYNILCLQVRESRLLPVYIYMFVQFLKNFLAHGPIENV